MVSIANAARPTTLERIRSARQRRDRNELGRLLARVAKVYGRAVGAMRRAEAARYAAAEWQAHCLSMWGGAEQLDLRALALHTNQEAEKAARDVVRTLRICAHRVRRSQALCAVLLSASNALGEVAGG